MDKIEEVVATCQHETIINIEPEDGVQRFAVSKNLLCDRSEYFVAALRGNWKEASEGRLRIPGADVETIKLFIYWLRKGEIPSFLPEIELASSSHELHKSTHIDRVTLLARLWVLGDQILAAKLQNAAIKALLHIVSSYKTTPFSAIYEGCRLAPKGSKLSKFFLAEAKFGFFQAEDISPEEFEELASFPGFIADFMSGVKASSWDTFSGKRVFGYEGRESNWEVYYVEESGR